MRIWPLHFGLWELMIITVGTVAYVIYLFTKLFKHFIDYVWSGWTDWLMMEMIIHCSPNWRHLAVWCHPKRPQQNKLHKGVKGVICSCDISLCRWHSSCMHPLYYCTFWLLKNNLACRNRLLYIWRAVFRPIRADVLNEFNAFAAVNTKNAPLSYETYMSPSLYCPACMRA